MENFQNENKPIDRRQILISAVFFAFIIGAALFAYFVISPKYKRGEQTVAPKINHAENIGSIQQGGITAITPVRTADTNDHMMGVQQAPLEIIFYGDYDCPFSADFFDTLMQVKQDYQDQVKIVFRHYPLRIHAMALTGALAAECAGEQNKFWEMSEKLFAEKKKENLNTAQIDQDALALQLDIAKFSDCLTTQKYKDKIQQQFSEAGTFNIIGTPGIFIGQQQLSGAVPYEDFTDENGKVQPGMKSIIDKNLEK